MSPKLTYHVLLLLLMCAFVLACLGRLFAPPALALAGHWFRPSPPKTARGSRSLTWQEEQALAQKKRAATGKLAAWQFQNSHGLGGAKGRTEPLIFDGKVRVCVRGAT